jgi:Uncharacterized conserved protein (DUF2045)
MEHCADVLIIFNDSLANVAFSLVLSQSERFRIAKRTLCKHNPSNSRPLIIECHPTVWIQRTLSCIQCRAASLDPHLQSNPTAESATSPQPIDRIHTKVHPRLSRIPVDAHGNYIKEAQQDDTYPYLAFALDDFDDDSAQQLLLREDSDEFAVVMHVRAPHNVDAQHTRDLSIHTHKLEAMYRRTAQHSNTWT